MARIGIRELNQQTSQVLDRVRGGEVVEVTERGIPIAEIRPMGKEQSALAQLVADGRMIPATVDPAILKSLPMDPDDDVNVAELLTADREAERW